MMKKLFFATALLMPGLAYGGNLSADLSVQMVPGPTEGDIVIGSSIGFLIGVLSALMTYLLLYDTYSCRPPNRRRSWLRKIFGDRPPASGFRTATKIGTLPAFWFGGRWLTSYLNNHIDVWIVYYIAALVITYCLIISPAIVRLIISCWNKCGISEYKAVARLGSTAPEPNP